VFAAGDIVDWPEEKQFGKTVGQAAVVAANIISYLADKPLRKEYTGSPEAIILTNGKVRASAPFFMNVPDSFGYPTTVVWGCVPALPVGTCFWTVVRSVGQVENAPARTCAFEDGPVRDRTRFSS
jgi:hypothetical protein